MALPTLLLGESIPGENTSVAPTLPDTHPTAPETGATPPLLEQANQQGSVPGDGESERKEDGGDGLDRCTTKSFDTGDVDGMLEYICGGEILLPAHLLPERVDELVWAPSPLPPFNDEKSYLDLKTCLYVQFENGLVPDTHFEELVPLVINWMKQLVDTPCHTMWGSECQKGIEAITRMKTASASLKERLAAAESTLRALNAAALKSFRDDQARYHGKPNQRKVLEGKSAALQKWLSTRQTDTRKALEVAKENHTRAVQEFSTVVGCLLVEAHQQYMAEVDKPMFDEEKLFETLDADVAATTKESTPEEDVPPSEDFKAVPATLGFEAIQKLVGDALNTSGATIDMNTRATLAKNLGAAFTMSLFPNHEQADPPTEPPAPNATVEAMFYFFNCTV